MKKTHHSAKPIDINGIHYATRREAAKALGLSESGLSKRIKRDGLNKIDRPINTFINNIYPVTIDNQQFYSNADLAKYLNISDGTISRKLQTLINRNLPITKENILMFEKYRMTEVIHGKVYHHWTSVMIIILDYRCFISDKAKDYTVTIWLNPLKNGVRANLSLLKVFDMKTLNARPICFTFHIKISTIVIKNTKRVK